MQIPSDVRALLRDRTAADRVLECAERAKKKRAAREQAERRKRARAAAAIVLRFARELAVSCTIATNGVEIFRGGFHTRFTGTAYALRGGALAIGYHSYMGGGSWKGRQPRDFEEAPENVLGALVDAIESGAVWEHVRAPQTEGIPRMRDPRSAPKA